MDKEDEEFLKRFDEAPTRGVFYIDVSNLPKKKAEYYIKALREKFRKLKNNEENL